VPFTFTSQEGDELRIGLITATKCHGVGLNAVEREDERDNNAGQRSFGKSGAESFHKENVMGSKVRRHIASGIAVYQKWR
jgi:hypothetical protein